MGMTYRKRILHTKNVPERCPKESRSEVIILVQPIVTASTRSTKIRRILTNMTRKKNKQREYYSVNDVIKNLNEDIICYPLFAQAFTGCDTTSAIHKFGKTTTRLNTIPYFAVLGQITFVHRHTKTVYGNIRDRIQAIFTQCQL